MLTIVGNAITARITDAFSAFVPLEISTNETRYAAAHTSASPAAVKAASNAALAPAFLKSRPEMPAPNASPKISASGTPASNIAAESSAPPRVWRIGANTTIAKNPYATEGIAARSSTTGLKICAVFPPTISFRQTAVKMPSGTATAHEPAVTISVP